MNETTKEYNVLGSRIKLNAGDDTNANADKIVDKVKAEAEKIKLASPQLEDEKIFLLVALRMAEEKLELEKEFASNIKHLESSAAHALNLIDEVTPTHFS